MELKRKEQGVKAREVSKGQLIGQGRKVLGLTSAGLPQVPRGNF